MSLYRQFSSVMVQKIYSKRLLISSSSYPSSTQEPTAETPKPIYLYFLRPTPIQFRAVFMTGLLLCRPEEMQAVRNFPFWKDPAFVLTFFLAAAMGSLLNYATFLCTHHNSALTTTVVGCLKNLGRLEMIAGLMCPFLPFLLLFVKNWDKTIKAGNLSALSTPSFPSQPPLTSPCSFCPITSSASPTSLALPFQSLAASCTLTLSWESTEMGRSRKTMRAAAAVVVRELRRSLESLGVH